MFRKKEKEANNQQAETVNELIARVEAKKKEETGARKAEEQRRQDWLQRISKGGDTDKELWNKLRGR